MNLGGTSRHKLLGRENRLGVGPMTGSHSDVDGLTARQREVMVLVAQGFSNKEIARRLNITVGTVKIHVHAIYHQLRISNRTALAALVYRRLESGV